jgi:hypothetical protein
MAGASLLAAPLVQGSYVVLRLHLLALMPAAYKQQYMMMHLYVCVCLEVLLSR